MQHFSAGEFFNRELIKKRLAESKHVGLHEIMYPVMQGYDSYFLDTDIQLGGTDQTFNMQAGRILQKDLRNKESFIIANGFLTGTDGRKMSKTWNNAVWLTDEPDKMFGKIMSLKDDLIEEYFLLATNTPMEKVEEVKKRLKNGENPMILKKELSRTIVRELHGEKQADEAQQAFETTFQKKEKPSKEMITVFNTNKNSVDIIDVLVESGLCNSKSEAKRLIMQKGVDDEMIDLTHTTVEVENDKIYKVGKKRFLMIKKNQ
jgi:tyrosyl-tRNA synthetase